MQGIYKITNIKNNQSYIGKSNNIERRLSDHKRLAFTKSYKEYNKILYQAFRKYGIENFIFEILEELDNYSISNEREKYWIKYYNTYNNGYNESEGGDGGSSKGHCQGSANGRHKLTEEDVILIRTKFKEGCAKQDCYKLFQDKITLGGFARIWTGQTWKHIMPEVYTKENIKRNASLGRSKNNSSHNRLLSNEEVKQLRKWRQEGLTYKEIINKMNYKISLSTAKDIGNYRTYKEVENE